MNVSHLKIMWPVSLVCEAIHTCLGTAVLLMLNTYKAVHCSAYTSVDDKPVGVLITEELVYNG